MSVAFQTRSIVVVTAGLSLPSSTRLLADRLAAATSDGLVPQGISAEVTVIEARDHASALASLMLSGFASGALRRALDAVAAADAVIAVTPVFTASYSGLFKMFFDALDEDALKGKPVLMAATAGTARHSLVLEYAMRPMFAHLKAITLPTAVFAATEDWGAGSSGVHRGLAGRIERAGEELADLMAGRAPARRTDPFDEGSLDFESMLANNEPAS